MQSSWRDHRAAGGGTQGKKEGQMPSCASEISPPDRSGPGYTRRQALTDTGASRPDRRAASFPPRGGRAGSPRGRRRPPGAPRHRPRQLLAEPVFPGRLRHGAQRVPPFPHSPYPRRRGGPSRRRRRRPSRCSSAAGVTGAKGAASAGAGGPRSGAEPPPPAQPPRREGGGCQVRGARGRSLPGVGLGLGQVAFPSPSPAAR